METVFAHALEDHGAGVRKRIEDIEKIRSTNAVTLDAAETSPTDTARPPKPVGKSRAGKK